ncbi:hypothetical protein NDU88_010473 [Pleurodeles waltl]|uniref:Secreted protein n=1 Tax=Pleurodeles waltl TaxID=8319 RepID=A0AAV7S2R7_PLEWA|nr:hypothetical protein NDU88_010473 [Pleurodeles waltl]
MILLMLPSAKYQAAGPGHVLACAEQRLVSRPLVTMHPRRWCTMCRLKWDSPLWSACCCRHPQTYVMLRATRDARKPHYLWPVFLGSLLGARGSRRSTAEAQDHTSGNLH